MVHKFIIDEEGNNRLERVENILFDLSNKANENAREANDIAYKLNNVKSLHTSGLLRIKEAKK
jgi:hypothetical protein